MPAKPPPEPARVTLEPIHRGHAAEMFALLGDPAIYPFLDYGPPASVDYLHDLYTRFEARQSPDGSEIWWNFVVRLQGGQAAGYVQATVLPGDKAYVGYVLASKHWGRGHACAAMQDLLQRLQHAHPVPVVLAVVEAANLRSAALLHRLGFAPGTAAQSLAEELTASERLYARAL